MNEKTSASERLAVSRVIYKEIIEVVKNWEKLKVYDIKFVWKGGISVDDEFFDFKDLS